jgi:hypothetical protein
MSYAQTSYQLIKVDFSKQQNSEQLKERFVSSCKFIQLETNENCLIGEMSKIIIQPDRIFILDIFKAQSVFIFDSDGKWIHTIHQVGNGPDEYINVTDIYFDEDRRMLGLLCRSNRKIMFFDKNGKLQKQEKLPALFFNIAKTKDGYIANTKNTSTPPSFKSNIVVLTSDLQVHRQAFQIPGIWESSSLRSETDFSDYHDKLYYYPSLDNNVYRLTKDSVITAYKYDFPGKNFPEAWKTPEYFFPPLKISIWDRQHYIVDLNYFKETDQYVICAVTFDGTQKLVFFSKTDKSVHVFLLQANPFTLSGFGRIQTITDDYIVTYRDADTFLRIMKDTDGEFAKMDPEGMKFLKKSITRPLNEDDNPILCLYRLK